MLEIPNKSIESGRLISQHTVMFLMSDDGGYGNEEQQKTALPERISKSFTGRR